MNPCLFLCGSKLLPKLRPLNCQSTTSFWFFLKYYIDLLCCEHVFLYQKFKHTCVLSHVQNTCFLDVIPCCPQGISWKRFSRLSLSQGPLSLKVSLSVSHKAFFSSQGSASLSLSISLSQAHSSFSFSQGPLSQGFLSLSLSLSLSFSLSLSLSRPSLSQGFRSLKVSLLPLPLSLSLSLSTPSLSRFSLSLSLKKKRRLCEKSGFVCHLRLSHIFWNLPQNLRRPKTHWGPSPIVGQIHLPSTSTMMAPRWCPRGMLGAH